MTDKAYERERNKMIPHAAQHANRTVQEMDFRSEDAYRDAWSRAFHKQMDLLWRKHRGSLMDMTRERR